MKIILSIICLGFLMNAVVAQNCDVAQTGVTIYNDANTTAVTTIAKGQKANFRFSIKNIGGTACTIPANSVTAVFDFPTLSGNLKPYIYTGPTSFTSGYFTWTYNMVDEVLEGTNTTAIPGGAGDASISINVKGNEAGSGNSNLNITQRKGVSDNAANNFSGARLTVAAGSRAAQVSAFTPSPDKCDVALNWKTTSEFNLSHFEIEYSPDGITFTKVGRTEGRDIAAGADYLFSYTQTKGEGYYRLKAVAKDGNYEYSELVHVTTDCNSKHKITVYPNPLMHDQALIVNIMGFSGKITGELFNGVGQKVSVYDLKNKANELSVKQCSAGTYMLYVKDEGGEVQSFKVVVTR
jgi:hypothetical protein